MRIAAGVLLILVSLVNGCLGASVTILGGSATVLSEAADDAIEAEQGEQLTSEQEADLAEARAAADEVSSAGGMLVLIGVAFLALFGLQLAAAICLFTAKAARFVMVVGGLGVAVGVWGLASGGFNVLFVLLSVSASVLAIVAARMMAAETSPGAPAPPLVST